MGPSPDTSGPSSRSATLLRLLEGDLRVEEADEQLDASSGSGAGKQPVGLTSAHLRAALTRYLTGRWSAEQLEAWADFVEMRDDIDIPASEHRGLRELLFELASPALFGELTSARARLLLDELDGQAVE